MPSGSDGCTELGAALAAAYGGDFGGGSGGAPQALSTAKAPTKGIRRGRRAVGPLGGGGGAVARGDTRTW